MQQLFVYFGSFAFSVTAGRSGGSFRLTECLHLPHSSTVSDRLCVYAHCAANPRLGYDRGFF